MEWTNETGEKTERSHVHQLHLCVSTVIHEKCDLMYTLVRVECDKSTRLCHTYLSHQTFNNTRCFISTHDSVRRFWFWFWSSSSASNFYYIIIQFEYVCDQIWCLLSKNGIDFLLLISADWSYCCRGKCPELLCKQWNKACVRHFAFIAKRSWKKSNVSKPQAWFLRFWSDKIGQN